MWQNLIDDTVTGDVGMVAACQGLSEGALGPERVTCC